MKWLHTLLFLCFAFLATANPAGGSKSPRNSPHTSPSNQPGETANYKAAQKHAKGQLQLDHTYAFNKGDRLSHTVLVVGKVVKNAAGELDFEATGFDITKYRIIPLQSKLHSLFLTQINSQGQAKPKEL